MADSRRNEWAIDSQTHEGSMREALSGIEISMEPMATISM